MKIIEIFHSIEGEGINIGTPEVFIRLAGCNLRCKWCDTKYSWNNGQNMGVDEIIKEIAGYPCKSVSITGGEPLLQSRELIPLVKKLKKDNYWIQLNTNGTLFDGEIFETADLISMDCKCPSSETKSDLEILRKTKDLFKTKTQFKFIISNEEDYKYAKKILSFLLKDAAHVIFQPEWDSRRFSRELVDLVKRDYLNVRVIHQQQKIIGERGFESRRI